MNLRGHLLTKIASWNGLRCAPVLPLLLFSGCGSELAEVHGTVSLDGKAVAAAPDIRGTVLFSPTEQGLATGSGTLDESGKYTVFVGSTEGLRPGTYRVAVSVTRILPAQTPGGTPSGQRITPREYAAPMTSGLHAQVRPGANTFDFALSSRPGKSK